MGLKILLINVHSTRNTGDQVLMLVTLQELQKNFPGCSLSISMDDPQSYSGPESTLGSIFTWVKHIHNDGRTSWRAPNLIWLIPASLIPILIYRWTNRTVLFLTPKSLRSLILAYLEADFLVSKPGGFLYSSGRGLTLILSLYIMTLGLLAGKPLYLLPQSIGPFRHRWELNLVKKVLSAARVVMVREPISYQVLQNGGFHHPRFATFPDPAFLFLPASPSIVEDWLKTHQIEPASARPLLGLTMIDWGAQNSRFDFQKEYEAACAATARYFINQIGGKVILFSQVTGPTAGQDDRLPAQRVQTLLEDLSSSIIFIQEPLAPDLLMALYGRMDLFVGARMHSNIFALKGGVPVLAIGYLHKTLGIMKMVGLDQWVVDIQQASESVLVERLSALWSARQEIRYHLLETIPGLIEQASQVGKLIAEDFSTFQKKSR
jgi:colanic acid/amylovoran biosynthesis protein